MALAQKSSWAVSIVAIIGYAIIANFTNQSTEHMTLGVLVALAPIILAIIFLIWQSRSWSKTKHIGLLASVAAGCVTLWLMWPQLNQHYSWIYWLEHESLQMILLFTFARTLTHNSVPLCTQFAQAMHENLTPKHQHYAKQVTIAWMLFFILIIIISSTLFFLYPIGIWSIFANFIYFPLVILMFIAEFFLRKLILPDVADSKFMDAIHAFQNRTKG